ncbi:sigma-70 family RNA polymerase sigma factor [Oceanobacillus kapialis]|uniref:Sigma-70 family RNA polymerase sigma factor n=1 Tax=Oceanobacillus kapialis TaxID=481353 RepID=A0ABW5PXZ5_9BACI
MIKIKGLIINAKRGDKDSFIRLFQIHRDQLYRIAFVYTKNREDALDVIQETAYRAFRNISSLKSSRYFKTWLIKITINCAMNVLNSRKNNANIDPGYLDTIVAVSEDVPLHITIEQLLSLLDSKEKTVIILKFYFDYTFKQISETMELPLGTVKSLYYRSLGKLKNNVEREDYYED